VKRSSKWFVPQWEGVIEGYVTNTLRKQFFRVQATMTEDDYMQEAFLVFLRVSKTYEGKIKATEPQHFTALFKRAWANRLNDLSNDDTAYRERFVSDHRQDRSTGEEVQMEQAGETDNDGSLAILIRQAPREVAMVLNLFLNAPQEILEVALGSWQGRNRRYAAGGSEPICKLLGLDPRMDVLARVEEHFASV
jgi:hypothetical protein